MVKIIRCPNCEGSQTRYRVKTKDHICYVCGTSWKINEEVSDGRDI